MQLAAKCVPGAGAALSAFRGFQWFLNNQGELAEVFNRFLEALDGLNLSEAPAPREIVVGIHECQPSLPDPNRKPSIRSLDGGTSATTEGC